MAGAELREGRDEELQLGLEELDVLEAEVRCDGHRGVGEGADGGSGGGEESIDCEEGGCCVHATLEGGFLMVIRW